ncbi:MAG: DUF3025 domain-containing protein [Usitatibacter sp.]
MDWAAARERMRTPLYAPLASAFDRLSAERWPTHDELTVLASHAVTARGSAIRFVMPRGNDARERRYYELRIAESGEIETRPGNWHDLFNALAWIAYPRAQAAIHAQHAAILEERGEEEAKRRSPERDALTLFDEGGVVVASGSPELSRLIADFEWKELFWRRRGELEARMRFFAFGHALHEQALAPYHGMVAKTVSVEADGALLALPLEAQVARVDELLAAHFSDRTRFSSPRAMPPLPVLGIPRWHPDTALESFYDDAKHFRSKGPRPSG